MVNNFVIDHVLRGIMTRKDGEYMWSINQITNPSLNVALSDTAQAVDALGTVIQEFDRGRSAEFSAENSIFDLSLYAAQMGRKVEVASDKAEEKIVVPAFETIDVKGTDAETHVTKKVPIAPIARINILNGDGTLGKVFKSATTASAEEFAYDEENHTISLPTGLAKGSQLFVMYEYESAKATSVTANAVDFPKAGKFVLEVLGTSVCDPDTLVHAYVVFPSAKLDGNVDFTFATDGTHPFTIRAMQDYCDKEKKLFSIVIPEEE